MVYKYWIVIISHQSFTNTDSNSFLSNKSKIYKMVKIIALCFVALIALVAARPQKEAVPATACSPPGRYCRTTSDCCPGFHCLTYAAKCVTGSPIHPATIHDSDTYTLEAEETVE
ncbi:uncharacterized protein [Prorops nasuta]|uniref:uncharacterized protein n=1 Tax=Prorops nasuta TaxID=863751 RepID=UPI0034CD03FB